jgi:hypothetical protein
MNSAASPTDKGQRFAGVLIALWAGSLWTICGIVAPTLFAMLENRHQAGELAARFFHLETYLGVIAALALLVMAHLGKVRSLARSAVLFAAGLPLASQLLLSPLMEQARSTGNMARFGVLHGLGAVCFAGASLALLIVVWKFTRPAE